MDPHVSRGVHAYAAALRTVPGVLECVPAYASLLVRYDPIRWSADRLSELIFDLPVSTTEAGAGILHTLPVCYGGEFGPDLREVATIAQLSEAEITQLHQSRTYLAYQLGFLPGFAFLGRTPSPLHVSRRKEARTRVPAGSVGLAGEQTAVYPSASPGGWQLIGRCPLPLLTDEAEPRIRIRAGDRVQFYAINAADFYELQNQPQPWPKR